VGHAAARFSVSEADTRLARTCAPLVWAETRLIQAVPSSITAQPATDIIALLDRRISREVAVAPADAPSVAGRRPVRLTSREVDILRLLARGMSGQSATALTIFAKTADTHIRHIYTKLGVTIGRWPACLAQSTASSRSTKHQRHKAGDSPIRDGDRTVVDHHVSAILRTPLA
jgi:DNA-binding CsgD family transcriptional regulator